MSTSEEEIFYKMQGRRLKKARMSHPNKYTQEQIGAKFNLSQDSISNMENGKQPVNSFRLLEFARIYEKPISYFYMSSSIKE